MITSYNEAVRGVTALGYVTKLTNRGEISDTFGTLVLSRKRKRERERD